LIHSQEKRTSELPQCQGLNFPSKPSQLFGIPDVSAEKYKASRLQVEDVGGEIRGHLLTHKANH
jgi:hypothetical protein